MDELQIDREALLAAFLTESEEILARMEVAFVALEKAPEGELLHALFRDAHTLKGAAGIVGFDAVRDLAHALESVLERLRGHAIPVTDALVTLLLTSVDLVRAAIADAAAGRTEPSKEAVAFRDRLAEAAAEPAGSAAGAGGDPAAPAPAHGDARGAATPPSERAGAHAAASARTLRVDVTKLDRMLDLSGEIAIARGRLASLLESGNAPGPEEILAVHREADRLYLDLQELIMKARMVPIGPTFHPHARTVRDVAAACGKEARLVVEGEDVEVDTAVVEHVRDPLTHMVRNAIDHGIEAPETRRAAGKDPCGTVTLRAFHEAGSLVVQVADDGAGIDRARVAEKAVALGLVADPSRLTDDDVVRALCAPGLSTSDAVTEISGRGVGMDVVRRNVEALRGALAVESAPGRGTTMTVRLPLTLTIIQGFRVEVAGDTFIAPLDAVVECLALPDDAHAGPCGTGVVNLRGRPLPFVRLRELFGVEGPPPGREHVVVVQHGATLAGLGVDALLGECSAVIKPLGPMLRDLPGVAGSSILGNGRVALILDTSGLLREALRRAAA